MRLGYAAPARAECAGFTVRGKADSKRNMWTARRKVKGKNKAWSSFARPSERLLGELRRAVWAGSLGVLTLACSSEAENETGSTTGSSDRSASAADEGAPATASEFVDMLFRQACEAQRECFGIETILCNVDAKTYKAQYGIDWSRAIYDRSAAATCLDDLENWSCSGDFPSLESCRFVLEGVGKEGEPCESDIDCKGSLYCEAESQCPGACTAPAEEGESCGVRPCSGGLTCADEVCIEPAMLGQSCSTSIDCEGSLECVDEVCQNGTVYSRMLGESCKSSTECYGANFCDLDALKCVPAAEEGESCETISCAYGLHCTEKVCARLLEDGASCLTGFECEGELCESGQCTRRRNIGAQCTDDSECWSANCSAEGNCIALDTCE